MCIKCEISVNSLRERKNFKNLVQEFLSSAKIDLLSYKVCKRNINITLLRSPHVNKSSREQFNKKSYIIKIVFRIQKISKRDAKVVLMQLHGNLNYFSQVKWISFL